MSLFNSRHLTQLISLPIVLALTTLSVALVAPASACAADDARDGYQETWTTVADLLKRREYGSALEVLENAAEDGKLQSFTERIKADRSAIDGLQTLERIVLEQAAALSAGEPIEIIGIEYTVVKYSKTSKGDELVVKSKSTGKESKKRIADLPSSNWVQLTEPRRSELPTPPLTLGIFLAFDRNPDVKAARKLFNEASGEGVEVAAWLKRIAALEEGTPDAAGGDKPKGKDVDPIVGVWSLRFADGTHLDVEFRNNGTAKALITPAFIIDARKKKRPIPPNADKWTWEKKESGIYYVSAEALGVTGRCVIDGDQMAFAPPSKIRALRRAKQ